MDHNRAQGTSLPSDRSFGITVAVAGTVVAAWWWKNIVVAPIRALMAAVFLAILCIQPGL